MENLYEDDIQNELRKFTPITPPNNKPISSEGKQPRPRSFYVKEEPKRGVVSFLKKIRDKIDTAPNPNDYSDPLYDTILIVKDQYSNHNFRPLERLIHHCGYRSKVIRAGQFHEHEAIANAHPLVIFVTESGFHNSVMESISKYRKAGNEIVMIKITSDGKINSTEILKVIQMLDKAKEVYYRNKSIYDISFKGVTDAEENKEPNSQYQEESISSISEIQEESISSISDIQEETISVKPINQTSNTVTSSTVIMGDSPTANDRQALRNQDIRNQRESHRMHNIQKRISEDINIED